MANINIPFLPEGGMPIQVIFDIYAIQLAPNNPIMVLPAQLFRELAFNEQGNGVTFLELYHNATGRLGIFIQDEIPARVLLAPVDMFPLDALIIVAPDQLPRLNPRNQYLPAQLPAHFLQVPVNEFADGHVAGAAGMRFNHQGQHAAQRGRNLNLPLDRGDHVGLRDMVGRYEAIDAQPIIGNRGNGPENAARGGNMVFDRFNVPNNHPLAAFVEAYGAAAHRMFPGGLPPVNDQDVVEQAEVEVRGPAQPDAANGEADVRAPVNGANARIPRPPNAFIGFRKDHHEEVKAANPGIHNNDISKIIGAMWHNASAEVRARYVRKAEMAKAEHERLHPDYKYKPRKSAEKKRRMTNKKRAAALAVAEASRAEALAREDELQNEINDLPNGVHNPVNFVLDDGSRMYLQPQVAFGVEPTFAPQFHNAFYDQYVGLPDPEFMAMLAQEYQYNANAEAQLNAGVMEDAEDLELPQDLEEN